ncbi:MAG: hypothetical protein HKL86_06325 [Acidimicrobiaceae bacterium]|nr:hypothetical protein [Acidimicrobiaceae bacterium]
MFSIPQLEAIVNFVTVAAIQTVTFQMEGSGATVPAHAHASFFSEKLPIFDLSRIVRSSVEEVDISVCPDFPSSAFVLSSGSIRNRVNVTKQICEFLVANGLVYNWLIDVNGDIFIIPRTAEKSIRMNRKIGAATVGGIYLAYCDDSKLRNAESLRQLIWDRFQSFTAVDYEAALTDVTAPISLNEEILQHWHFES